MLWICDMLNKKSNKQTASSWTYWNDTEYSSFTYKLSLFLHTFPIDTSDHITLLKNNNAKILDDFGSVVHPEELAMNVPQELGTQTPYKRIVWTLTVRMRQSHGVYHSFLPKCAHISLKRNVGSMCECRNSVFHYGIKSRCQT